MKSVILHLLLSISLVAAVMLGMRSARLLYLITSAHPEETIYFRAPLSGFIRSLFVALWPCALYLLVLVVSRELAWSRFGKSASVALLIYIVILICQWVYLYRISLIFSRNA